MAATTDNAGQQNIRFSGHTLDKATKAKVHLENYYSNLITQHIERRNRFEKLFFKLTFCGNNSFITDYKMYNIWSLFYAK
jgi:hypothetical protein